MERRIEVVVKVCPHCQSAWLRNRGKKRPDQEYAWFNCNNCGFSWRERALVNGDGGTEFNERKTL